MSHAIYQTTAFILKTKNMRESNKLVYLYTEKFGLIHASMQSVRKLESKMRYHLHPHSLVDIDLVAGKNIWRITGIHEKKSSFPYVQTPWYRLISLVSDTLIRLCPGEERNERLWKNILIFFENLNENNEKFIAEYEIITMVTILSSLGYWEKEEGFFLEENPYEDKNFLFIQENKMKYITQINNSFYYSQL